MTAGRMILPTWEETDAIDEADRTPLEVIIHDHEPVGKELEILFRKQVMDLVEWLSPPGKAGSKPAPHHQGIIKRTTSIKADSNQDKG